MSEPRPCRTQLDAVERLKSLGFKCEKSKFNQDLKRGRVGTTAEGVFTEEALRAYGEAFCKRSVVAEAPEVLSSEASRAAADARLKNIEAERRQIKLDLERGRYILREDHELELAARLTFFRTQVEIFANHEAAEILTLLGVDEARLPELREHLRRRTARWLAAYDTDREFRVVLAEESGDAGD